jgi:hypothetical protein
MISQRLVYHLERGRIDTLHEYLCHFFLLICAALQGDILKVVK